MKRFTFGTIGRHALLLLVGLLILLPVIFTLLTSLKYFRDIISGSLAFTPTFDNYKELFLASRNSFTRLTLNSLIIGAGSTCIVVIFGGLASYSFTRYRWPGLRIRSFPLWAEGRSSGGRFSGRKRDAHPIGPLFYRRSLSYILCCNDAIVYNACRKRGAEAKTAHDLPAPGSNKYRFSNRSEV